MFIKFTLNIKYNYTSKSLTPSLNNNTEIQIFMKTLFSFLTITLLTLNFSFSQSLNKDDILGDWLTQEKDGKITIFKQGEKYFGKIIWGKNGDTKDLKNPQESLRGKDLIGLVILKDFDFTGKAWENGSIYDPKSGKTYSSNMKLKNPNQLDIRGFVGFSLLGRTTVWTRAK